MYSEGQKGVDCNLQRVCKKGKKQCKLSSFKRAKTLGSNLRRFNEAGKKFIISEEMTEGSNSL